jgi:hypothetical protein
MPNIPVLASLCPVDGVYTVRLWVSSNQGKEGSWSVRYFVPPRPDVPPPPEYPAWGWDADIIPQTLSVASSSTRLYLALGWMRPLLPEGHAALVLYTSDDLGASWTVRYEQDWAAGSANAYYVYSSTLRRQGNALFLIYSPFNQANSILKDSAVETDFLFSPDAGNSWTSTRLGEPLTAKGLYPDKWYFARWNSACFDSQGYMHYMRMWGTDFISQDYGQTFSAGYLAQTAYEESNSNRLRQMWYGGGVGVVWGLNAPYAGKLAYAPGNHTDYSLVSVSSLHENSAVVRQGDYLMLPPVSPNGLVRVSTDWQAGAPTFQELEGTNNLVNYGYTTVTLSKCDPTAQEDNIWTSQIYGTTAQPYIYDIIHRKRLRLPAAAVGTTASTVCDVAGYLDLSPAGGYAFWW